MPSPQFKSYIGIDYSGAKTAESSLDGLRVYKALANEPPLEVLPPRSIRRYWTRRGIGEWLTDQILDAPPILVGIDHGFSFPLNYFTRHGLAHDWGLFLDDFQHHWPTDREHTSVDFIRRGIAGNGAARTGDSTWLRLTEKWTPSAKSVFLFDVNGSVGKSTHAGLPWLRQIRRKVGDQCHFWPFDGWDVPTGKSSVVEVYPSIFSKRFPREDRDSHQQDAFATALWLRQADVNGWLSHYFCPLLENEDRRVAEIEGWILGVM